MSEDADFDTYDELYEEDVPDEYLKLMPAGQCNAECRRPAVRAQQIWCQANPPCTAIAGCSCHLFRLEKANPNGWEKFDQNTKIDYDPVKYFYRCWCST